MSTTAPGPNRVLASPWLLAAAVVLSFFWQIGASPLYDLDEGAFSEATREMLASGNFVTPRKDGEPRYDKPVLIYWAQAASVTVLGLNEMALRLPSALAATAWVIAVWVFVRARLDAATATAAGLAMVLSLQVSLIAKAATADALLNLFLALTFFDLYRWYLRRGRWTLVRVYLWMGLGFLTKGPVAVFFPVVVSLVFFVSERAFRDWLRAAFWLPGWAVFLVVALPWYVAVYLDSGPGFFESFFLHHNLGRFGDTIHGHKGFPGYYFVVLPLIVLPFTGWFLRLLPTLRRALSDPLDRFLWIWFVAVFVFFSFSGTKLPHYLVYGLVPLFILMARHRDLLVSRWLAFLPPLAFLGLLFVLPEVLALAGAEAKRADQVALLAEAQAALDYWYRLSVGAVVVAVFAIALWRRLAPWQGLVLVGLLQTALIYGALVPRVLETLQGPVKEAALLARELDRPTVAYRTNMPSFSVYRQAITPDRPPRPGDLVFLRVDKLPRLEADLPNLSRELVYRRGAVALVRMGPEDG